MIRNALLTLAAASVALAAEVPLLHFVPADARVVGGVHVQRTLTSPFGQFLLEQMQKNDEGIQKFVEATGFDPRRDLRELVFAGTEPGNKSGLVVARGVFNGPQIIAAAQSHGGTVSNWQGVQIVTHKDGKGALAVLDGDTLIAGQEVLVRQAVERRSGSAGAGTFAGRAENMRGQYDAWMIASGAYLPQAPGIRTPNAPAAALASIQETSGGVLFGDTVRVTGEAVTRSDKDAQALVDVIRFLAVMARSKGDQDPNLRRIDNLLNTMDLRADASTVRMTLSIPEADLEQLMKPRSAQRAAR